MPDTWSEAERVEIPVGTDIRPSPPGRRTGGSSSCCTVSRRCRVDGAACFPPSPPQDIGRWRSTSAATRPGPARRCRGRPGRPTGRRRPRRRRIAVRRLLRPRRPRLGRHGRLDRRRHGPGPGAHADGGVDAAPGRVRRCAHGRGHRPGREVRVHRRVSGRGRRRRKSAARRHNSGDGLRAMFAASGMDVDDAGEFVEAMREPGALTAA